MIVAQPSAFARAACSANTRSSRARSSPVAHTQPSSTPTQATGRPEAAHQGQHLVGGLAGLGGALEVEPAQLDGVPARLLDDGERVRERGGIERPRVQGQAHGHGNVSL